MSRWLRWLTSRLLRSRDAGPRLVIVRHHRVYEPTERPLYRLGVAVGVFERQLELLERLALTPVTVTEGLTWLAGAREGRRVALSFDDGYRDNLGLALPRLERRGARATFYLAAGLIESRTPPWWDRLAHRIEHARRPDLDWSFEGRRIRVSLSGFAAQRTAVARLVPLLYAAPEMQERRLQDLADALRAPGEPECALATWAELAALERSGMEIGAHTLTHPFLTRLSPERQDAEIGGSLELIAQRLGVRCEGLAYPGGDYDEASVAACARHRLRYAVSTRRGDVIALDQPYQLPRRGMPDGACLSPLGGFSEAMVTAELTGRFDRWRRAAEAMS